MAPVVPDPQKIRSFESAAAFERWLSANHDSADELWLKIHKKGSGLPTVSTAEALEVALCWGWIDGLRKPLDETSFLQRYTPRRPKSIWSQKNRAHVEQLIAAGRMTAHGLRHVEAAKADGRWDAAYAGAAEMAIPDDLLAAIKAEPRAYETFQRLNAANRFALAFRTGNMKTTEGRVKKIASLVEMLKRGETPHPNGAAKAK